MLSLLILWAQLTFSTTFKLNVCILIKMNPNDALFTTVCVLKYLFLPGIVAIQRKKKHMKKANEIKFDK